MDHTKIEFEHPLNPSLQVGDEVYFSQPSFGPILGIPVLAGKVYSVFRQNNYIVIDKDPAISPIINAGDFILFSKDITTNESSLKGYYADVTFENASHEKCELFAFSSEVGLSSK